MKGYTLYKHEPVSSGIRRIIRWQLRYARDVLSNPALSPEKKVHETRKALKRIRATLRLIRDEIGDEQYRASNIYFRDVGRKIGFLRDYAVHLNTLKKLSTQAPPSLQEQIEAVKEALKAEYQEMSEIYFNQRKILHEVQDDIEVKTAFPKEIKIRRKGFTPLKGGLFRVYGRGRNRLNRILRDPGVDSYHDLRKRVKYLWHLHQVLRASWPKMFGLVGKALEETSENLGEEHDLAILAQYVISRHQGKEELEKCTSLLKFIGQQREKLQQSILISAYYLYVEKPAQFTSRVRKYYNLARKEPVRRRKKAAIRG